MRFTTRPELVGTFGMVSSTHWLATASAMATLEQGGNAFDAAAAAGFVLQVVEPHLNGPGGEVPAIFYSAREGATRVLCGQGPAPAGLSCELIHRLSLDAVPGTGLLPAVVPGGFGGWMALLRDHGQLPLEEVLKYAIGYADNGYPVVYRLAACLKSAEDFFNEHWPTSAKEWLINGQAPKPNARFSNPAIAATYRRLVDESNSKGGDRAARIERAREVFYTGFVAELIDKFFRSSEVMDTSRQRNRGVLTGDDLARWQPTFEPSLTYDYQGYTVHKTGPWGQGPVFLQQLALLEGFDFSGMDTLGPDFVHLVIESAKLAFADREVFYGDPNFAEVPIETLLSKNYNSARRRQIDLAEASHELRPGLPELSRSRLEFIRRYSGKGSATFGSGEPTFAVLPEVVGDTVHVDVVDRWGNMISATPSGGWLQSSPAIPGLGFCVTTRGQIFWLEPGMPSSLEPLKRPRTTLSPTLVTQNGKPVLAFGTPGGDNQDQWSVQMFLRHVHHRMNLQEAIDAPMFQSSHFPSSFYPRGMQLGRMSIERRFPKSTIDELKRRGHLVDDVDEWSLGRLCGVRVAGGFMRAAATPRYMQGYAAGR